MTINQRSDDQPTYTNQGEDPLVLTAQRQAIVQLVGRTHEELHELHEMTRCVNSVVLEEAAADSLDGADAEVITLQRVPEPATIELTPAPVLELPQRAQPIAVRALAAAGDRGTAIIEFALILPLLLGLVLGMVDFGLILNDHQELRDATRVSARNAIVGTAPAQHCATENLSGLETQETVGLICGVKQSVGSDVRVKLDFGAFDEGEKLTLCTMTPTNSLFGVHQFLGNGAATAKYEMRIENTDHSTFTIAEEAALVGHDWSWCS